MGLGLVGVSIALEGALGRMSWGEWVGGITFWAFRSDSRSIDRLAVVVVVLIDTMR